MNAVSLDEALSLVLEAREKHAQIETNPKGFFVHVRVPEHVASRLREVQKSVLPAHGTPQDIDHVTLVYTKKALEDHPPDRVHAALDALRRHGETVEPIEARLQGWAYFDGASKDGKPATALVALVDAPGLDHLHVDLSRKLKDHGIFPSGNHIFTPHITIGYLPQHGRAEKELPPIDGVFTIDKAHVAARDHHEIPLSGGPSLGEKAAAAAMAPDVTLEEFRAGGKGKTTYPRDHVSAMRVPKGGSCCANCKYVDKEAHACKSAHYRTWNGGDGKLPALPLDEICSDWYEPSEPLEKKSAMNPALRSGLIGAGIGGAIGAGGAALDYATDTPEQRAMQPLLKRMLINGGVGAVGGGVIGGAHRLSAPDTAINALQAEDVIDQFRHASLGEEAAREASKR